MMNIKQGKEQISNTMKAYFAKDEQGRYLIPPEKQRPIFLMGAPGIGKTAIMEQVAQELNVGLISYSMTHHTRQSALGLPFIVHKEYKGKAFDVSEYTMSEIIASIYDLMEKTDVVEGILFLDEINCVSETLSPVMLQFLQYKVFGRHRVPEGWIIVTAGNPPEYNNSVRDFDMATWDRLKRIDVEPDYDVWKEYAVNRNVHPAVLTYLDIRKKNFYHVESTVDGKRFVTARGWEDLSIIMNVYERMNLPIDELLIGQYLQDTMIARDFATYYDLFKKYKSDYQVDSILAGTCTEELVERARKSKFDERLSLLGLLLDAIGGEVQPVMQVRRMIEALFRKMTQFKELCVKPAFDAEAWFRDALEQLHKQIAQGVLSGNLKPEDRKTMELSAAWIEACLPNVAHAANAREAFQLIKSKYNGEVQSEKKKGALCVKHITHAIEFLEKAYGDGNEMAIFTTELTLRQTMASFLSVYGCEKYFEKNRKLQLDARQNELLSEIDKLLF